MGLWKKGSYESKSLNNNIEVETLIIGAGLTGLMAAYQLKDKDICIVEKNKIGEGVTKNTTAKITYLQERIYTRIKSLRGIKEAENYLKSQKEGIKELTSIIEKENIKCDLERTTSYIFASVKKEIPKLKQEYELLKSFGIEITKSDLPFNTKSYLSYKVEDTYTFNPLKFLTAIYNILTKKGVSIYENTKVTNIKRKGKNYICETGKFKIKAKNVVFACGYPYFTFPFLMPLKVSVEKSYIIISKVNDYKNISCISTNKPTYSCRYYKDKDNIYQVSLSSSHNIAFKLNDNKRFENVKKMFDLKEDDIIMKYSNTDIITPDYLPYIGELKENMYIATGYNTWGMINSTLAGELISDLINKKENKYKELFDPKRISLASITKIPFNIFSSTKSYISTKISKNKSWYSNKVKIENGIGTYTDEQGLEHKVKNKCPHLGCSLIFNEEEKTWDCPCHSSRFDIDGYCLKGPSNYDIKVE